MDGIHYDPKGRAVSFVGPDAVALYRAAVLRSGIGLMAKGIKPTRGASMKKLLVMATGLTQKPYKRTEHEKARADLGLWIDAMKSALPQEQR